jgi:hypothetical protein
MQVACTVEERSPKPEWQTPILKNIAKTKQTNKIENWPFHRLRLGKPFHF